MARDEVPSRETLLNCYWWSTSDWPLPTAITDAGLPCNENHHRIIVWHSLLAWLKETSQPSSTYKAGKDENGVVLPSTHLPQYHGDHWPDQPLAHAVLTLPQQHKLDAGCKPDLTALDSTSSLSGPAGQQATLVTHLVLEANGVPKLSSEWQGLCRAPFLRLPRSSSLSVQGASVAELVPESGSK